MKAPLDVAAVLAFEREHPHSNPQKFRAIRETFDVPVVSYFAELHRIIDLPEANVADPLLVGRLLRLREERRARRQAERLDETPEPVQPARPQSSFAFPPTRKEEDAAAAQAEKERGMAAAVGAAGPDWTKRADAMIRLLAGRGRRFTAEDVRRELGGDPPRPNAMGARFHAAARAGLIVRVDYQQADRPSLHRHPIGVWVGRSDDEGGDA